MCPPLQKCDLCYHVDIIFSLLTYAMFRGAIRLAISNGVKSSRTLAKSSAGVKASQKLFFSAALAAPLVGLKDNSAQETYVSRMKKKFSKGREEATTQDTPKSKLADELLRYCGVAAEELSKYKERLDNNQLTKTDLFATMIALVAFAFVIDFGITTYVTSTKK